MSLEQEEDRRSKRLALLERLKKPRGARLKPTDEQLRRAISGYECSLTPEESQAERTSTDAEHYDLWIEQAMADREQGHVRWNDSVGGVEHPTSRLFRLGIESIKLGTPSELFLSLLEEIGSRAKSHDVLSLVFPVQIPTTIRASQMTSAKDDYILAKAFLAFARRHPKLLFKTMKSKFKIHLQMQPRPYDSRRIDRALDKFGLNWEATPGPEKTPRSKRESLDNLLK